MTQRQHGYCPQCSKYVALKSDGTAWPHKAPVLDLSAPFNPDLCDGSFKPARPANYIDLSYLLADADFADAEEGVRLTEAQVWARLLLMTSEERMKFLAMMQEAAGMGRICEMMEHRERMEGMAQIAALYAAAASTQKHEAETYYKRMRRALDLAHFWRSQWRYLRRITAL